MYNIKVFYLKFFKYLKIQSVLIDEYESIEESC